MRNFLKKAFALLLCLACCLPVLTACKTENDAPSGQETTAPEGTETLGILLSELSQYKIIYPEGDCSLEVYQKLYALQKEVKTLYGSELEVKDDFYREGSTKFTIGEYEILIGKTNRPESTAVYADLKKENDYKIRMVGKKLVIAGWSSQAIEAAIDAFFAQVSEADPSALYFYQQNGEIEKLGEYRLDQVLLGGEQLSEFALVYEDSVFCGSLASTIAESIQNSVGYHMTVMSDTAAKKDGYNGKMLLIGNTKMGLSTDCDKSKGYYIGKKDSNICFYGSSEVFLAKATEWMTDALDTAKSGTVELDPAQGTVNVVDTSLKVMSYNVLCDYNPKNRSPYVLAQIRAFDPDTFGVQEAGEPWIEIFDQELSDTYARVGIGREVGGWGETNCIFYKKDKFNLIESGTKWMSDTPDVASKYDGSEYIRIFTYALLERKSDGARFMHINLHPEHGSEINKIEVRKKQFKVLANWINQNVKVPFFLTGDLNCEFTSTEMIQLVNDVNVETSSEIAYAANKVNTFKEVTIDFVLFSKNDFKVYIYDVDNTKIGGDRKIPSDHAPVMVTYDLKK